MRNSLFHPAFLNKKHSSLRSNSEISEEIIQYVIVVFGYKLGVRFHFLKHEINTSHCAVRAKRLSSSVPTLKLLAVTFLSFDDKNMAQRLNLSTQKVQRVCYRMFA